MTSSKLLSAVLTLLAIALSSCAASSAPSSSATVTSGLTNGSTLPPLSGSNVMALTVNGSLCSAANSQGYLNKPCVSVTICDLTGANCQTIDDILLDTGSFGLRVFSSILNTGLAAALTPLRNGNSPIVECVNFVDNSADWGPVELAKVGLGGEPGIDVPIQVINSTFGNSATYCPGADADPVAAGFNGILGVGLFAQDCGEGCATTTQNKMYYACASSSDSASCSEIAVSLAQQVTNPVSLLPLDNNGVIVELPSVSFGGTDSASGYLVLGIGTRSDNTPVGVTAYAADPDAGEFTTSFSGSTYSSSFLDSGSNALYFSPPSSISAELPDCGNTDAGAAGWFCPASTTLFSAMNSGYSGSTSGNVSFASGNFLSLANTSNSVFSELAGSLSDGGQSFDWGLPFYLGRNVYVGIENTSSSLGTGPYWAY
jgi:hypothetical protein